MASSEFIELRKDTWAAESDHGTFFVSRFPDGGHSASRVFGRGHNYEAIVPVSQFGVSFEDACAACEARFSQLEEGAQHVAAAE